MSFTYLPDQSADAPENTNGPENNVPAKSLSYDDFITYIKADIRRMQPEDDTFRQAMAQGFVYDREGQPVRDPETLTELQRDWRASNAGFDLGSLPLYFRDPAAPSKDFHVFDGRNEPEHATVGELTERAYYCHYPQPTKPKDVPKMTPWEKFCNVISFGLWKPDRVREAERNNAVSRMERLKIAEGMGFPLSKKEKRSYAKLRNLKPDQLKTYINKDTLPEDAQPTVPTSPQKTKEERLREITERNLEALRHEAEIAEHEMDRFKFENSPEHTYGRKLLKDYLTKCQNEPKSEQRLVVNNIVRQIQKEPYTFPLFIQTLGKCNTTAEQFEAVIKTGATHKLEFFRMMSMVSYENYRNNFMKEHGDKYGLAAAFSMAPQDSQDQPVNEDPQLGEKQPNMNLPH